uniref:GAG protein n=1 Tax=Knipowitschia caucasica TaxID=637954 RepID=A0AAV2MPW1_KNICA
MPEKILERRLRVAVAHPQDPLLAGTTDKPTAVTQQPRKTELWSDMLNDDDADMPPLFEDLLEVDPGDEGADGDDAASDFLEAVDMDDVEEDSTFPAAQSRPSSASEAATPVDSSLYDVCKRAAAKLNITWPAAVDAEDGKRDLYDGKRLPPAHPPPKQLLPAVSACMREVGRFWNNPLRSKLPVQGYSKLEIHGMKELGLAEPPAVEPSVAFHLHPNHRSVSASSQVSLPTKSERVTSSILQRMYRYASQSACVLNTVTLLSGYQGELLEEMGQQLDSGSPNPVLWEEICVVNDLILRSTRGAVQGCGHVMGLAVAGERGLWLNHSGLTDAQKAEVMDTAYDPTKGLFGPALEKMKETSTLRKEEGAAFNLCLPRKQPPRPAQPQRAGPSGQTGPRVPRAGPGPQRGATQHPGQHSNQHSGQQQRPGNSRPWGKHSYAAAAAKNRSSQPGESKKKRNS